eukprot:CAMPEP_0170169042 /NCGR_PEP_ID=MMETSP0040_2-20121228/1982_1 /TAXON_ID=641309 /ORGANISM="Lotharella oceanica, Strain CCMP622" /LENGTH=127 /DNA_ID=CAMNT_0010407561 /DNA_START=382 /DNA_END=765 /DNA_ORIENTATION=-
MSHACFGGASSSHTEKNPFSSPPNLFVFLKTPAPAAPLALVSGLVLVLESTALGRRRKASRHAAPLALVLGLVLVLESLASSNDWEPLVVGKSSSSSNTEKTFFFPPQLFVLSHRTAGHSLACCVRM